MANGNDNKLVTLADLVDAYAHAVNKSGDVMTGNLKIQHSDDSYVQVKNTDCGMIAYLYSAPDGYHGIWSPRYYNNPSDTSKEEYIICRNPDGTVTVADHYNKDEVDARGVLYTDVSIGTVTVGTGGYIDIRNNIPSGKTPIAALIKTFGTATGAITVTADGEYIMGAPNTTVTGVVIRYYYRG